MLRPFFVRYYFLFACCTNCIVALGQDVIAQYEAQFHSDTTLRSVEEMISRDHFERAIVLLDQYLEQLVTGSPADSLLLAKALQYKSFCHYFINQPDLALKAVENALRIQRQYLSDKHFETGISLLYIGLIKTRSREFAFAWKCLQKSEEIRRCCMNPMAISIPCYLLP